jgi:hypothetical protein
VTQHKTGEAATDFPTGLSKPAQRALAGAGYGQLEQLAAVREAELLEPHGMGPKGLRILRSALQARSLSFADERGGQA